MTALELVLSKLPDAKPNGQGWIARCPAHEDHKPSLAVAVGDDGRVLVHCHAGCTAEAVVKAIGLTMADLMPLKAKTARSQPASQIVAMYDYRDESGALLYQVIRYKPKAFRQRRPDGAGGWLWNLDGTPRVLYRLPELLAADPAAWVFLSEGEKDADALAALDLVATTNPGGAGKWRKEYSEVLRGRRVAILPDADGPGHKHALVVARALHDKAADVRIVDLPGPGTDVNDWIEWLDSRTDEELAEALVQMADAASVWTPAPVEARDPTPVVEPYWPFPVDVLPKPLRGFVAEGATALGCEPAFVALPLLAACGAAIGNSRVLQLKRGWVEPPVLWAVLVGESGTVKSPAQDLALGAVERRQSAAVAHHAAAVEAWQAERQRHEVAMTAWKRAGGEGMPPEEPKRPVCERVRADDLTVEALAVLLADNPRGLLVARDELAQWFGAFDRYAQRRGGDAPAWLRMHYARSLIIDRKTGDRRTIYVPRAAVCLTGGIQPGVLRRALGQEHEDDGLAARLLFALPPRPVRRWSEAEVRPGLVEILERVFEHLYDLMPQAVEEDSGWAPAIINLGPEAKKRFVAFYNEHGAEQRELTGALAAAWSKLEAYAARLALIVHCVRVADGERGLDPFVLDTASLDTGVRLVEWFKHEAQRVYGLLHEEPAERERRELVDLIRRRGGTITPRELMRASRAYPLAEDAKAALDALVEAGLGRWETVKPGPQGGRPSRCFSLAKQSADSADC